MDNDVHQLIGELAGAVATDGSDMRRLGQAARCVANDEELLRHLLAAVVSRRALAASIAADSYWHGNGFAKLVLHRHDDPKFLVRLHVWPHGSPDRPMFETGNIHNHRWAFASVVLAGGLHVEYFEERRDFYLDDEKVLPCRRFGYTTTPGSSFGRLQQEGTVALLSIGGNSYGWPERHYGDDEQLHIVTPFVEEFTATLVIQGPTRSAKALVYQPLGREPLADTGKPLSTGDVVELAEMTLAHMADRA